MTPLLIFIQQGPKWENKMACVDLQVPVTLCSTRFDWISCFRASARSWRGQEQMPFCTSQYLGSPSHGPPETSHRFKADTSWRDPVFKNCNRNLPLRHLTGVRSVHTDHQIVQIWRDLPCVRIARSLVFISLLPPPIQNTGFTWGYWGIFYTPWAIQKGQIFTNIFIFLAYCLWYAVYQGKKYFHYGLWVKRIACDIQEKAPLLALLWNFDMNYHIFKSLIPKNIFLYYCKKWSNLLP